MNVPRINVIKKGGRKPSFQTPRGGAISIKAPLGGDINVAHPVLAQMITPSTLGQADQTSSHQGCTNVNLQLIPSQSLANVIGALCNIIACKGVYIDLHTLRHSACMKGQMHRRRDTAEDAVLVKRHMITTGFVP